MLKLAGNAISIETQLTPKEWLDFKKKFTGTKGKRDKKCNAVIFPSEQAAKAFINAYNSGEVRNLKKEFQQFFTPEDVADAVTPFERFKDNDKILEPSAGDGSGLLKSILKTKSRVSVWTVEIDEENCERIREIDDKRIIYCTNTDFLEVIPNPIYDYIIMNPPFAKNQDIKHVLHAFKFLVPGGKLIAITSPHWEIAKEKECVEFREWLATQSFFVEEIEEGAFKTSGTKIKTTLLQIIK
jgi:predicted RNA methylase